MGTMLPHHPRPVTVEKEIHRPQEEISTARVLCHKRKVLKTSQIRLLTTWCDGNVNQFRWKVRVDPPTFDGILEKIHDHHIFSNNSNLLQLPVDTQLAIFLFRAGHYGNAASLEAIGHWAGISLGTVVNLTNHVMVALLALHDELIRLPTSKEKEVAKEWVAGKVCLEWRDGVSSCVGLVIRDGVSRLCRGFSEDRQPGQVAW
jgi:hypothetical protein